MESSRHRAAVLEPKRHLKRRMCLTVYAYVLFGVPAFLSLSLCDTVYVTLCVCLCVWATPFCDVYFARLTGSAFASLGGSAVAAAATAPFARVSPEYTRACWKTMCRRRTCMGIQPRRNKSRNRPFSGATSRRVSGRSDSSYRWCTQLLLVCEIFQVSLCAIFS